MQPLPGCFIQWEGKSVRGLLELQLGGRCVEEPREASIIAFDNEVGGITGYLRLPDLIPTPSPRTIDGPFVPPTEYAIQVSGLPVEATYADVLAYSGASWDVAITSSFVVAGAPVVVTMSGPRLPPPYGLRIISYASSTTHVLSEPEPELPTRTTVVVAPLPTPTTLTLDRDELAIRWDAAPTTVVPMMITAAITGRTNVWTLHAPGNYTAILVPEPPPQLGVDRTWMTSSDSLTIQLSQVHLDGASYVDLLRAPHYPDDLFQASYPATRLTAATTTAFQ
jgi:hypothetical protein